MKLQKKCTTIMLALILSIQAIPVMASSNTGQSGTTARVSTSGVEDLTVSQATRRATDNSTNIRNMQDSITLSREQEQRLLDQLFDSNNTSSITEASAKLMEADLQRALNLDSIDAQRDTIGYLVTRHFITIITAEKALETYDANIAILERELEILKIKVDLGLESQVNYDLAVLRFERAVNDRATLVNSIDEAYRSLNRIMGTPIDRKYNLVFDAEYEELGDIDIVRHMDHYRRNSIAVQAEQNKFNVVQFEFDNYRTPINMETGEILPGVSREEQIINVNRAARSVSDARVQAEDNILNLYNSIRSSEARIQSSMLDLESMERELEILNTKYKLGNATMLEIDKHKLKIIELEEEIMKQQLEHHLLVMQFNNPNISA